MPENLLAQKMAAEAGISSGGGLDNLMLMLQYLSSAGSAVSAGQPIGPALDKVTQQSIASQNFMKMMSRMLAGDIPEGGKITVDGKGTQLNIPTNLYGQKRAAEAGINLPKETNQTPAMSNYLNPSNSQSGISASALAGLTPQDLSTLMGLKLTQEDLGRKKVSDIVDMIYKMQSIQQASQPKPEDRIYPVPVPGIGQVTLRQWNALTSEDKEYATAKWQAAQMGDSSFMSKREWQMTEPTERKRFVQSALENPAIMEGAKELAGIGKVTWTTATQELTKRFGKLDPTGMWAVTPELQASHRLAQKILVELKGQGYEPLRSINMAEEYANKYYDTLNSISEEANKIKNESIRRRYILEQTKTINSIFKSQLGFSPGE